MKIKIGKKKQVNEIVGVAMAVVALFSVLVMALGVFYAMMKSDLQKGDKKLKDADKAATEGAEKIENEQEKKDFIEKYNAAKQELNETAKKLKEASQDQAKAAALGGRPSTIIATALSKVIAVIREAKAKYPQIEEMSEADAYFVEVYNDISVLDFKMLMSVRGPDSLYEKVLKAEPKVGEKFADQKQLFTFGSMLANAVDRKASKLPPFKPPTEKPAEAPAEKPEESPEETA